MTWSVGAMCRLIAFHSFQSHVTHFEKRTRNNHFFTQKKQNNFYWIHWETQKNRNKNCTQFCELTFSDWLSLFPTAAAAAEIPLDDEHFIQPIFGIFNMKKKDEIQRPSVLERQWNKVNSLLGAINLLSRLISNQLPVRFFIDRNSKATTK